MGKYLEEVIVRAEALRVEHGYDCSSWALSGAVEELGIEELKGIIDECELWGEWVNVADSLLASMRCIVRGRVSVVMRERGMYKEYRRSDI